MSTTDDICGYRIRPKDKATDHNKKLILDFHEYQ